MSYKYEIGLNGVTKVFPGDVRAADGVDLTDRRLVGGRTISSGLGANGLSYRMSKTAVNAFTLVAAQALRDDGIRVNAVHPGWVRTEMGGPRAPLSPQDGARVVVALALREKGPTGVMFDSTGAVDW